MISVSVSVDVPNLAEGVRFGLCLIERRSKK
jgi:hypothetical protein